MKRLRRVDWRYLALGLATLVAACATHTGTVVLLPEKDGRDTAVIVKDGKGEVVLDRPYAAVETTSRGPRSYASSAAEVGAAFGTALSAQPARPTRFTLYFVEGTDEFTEDSKRILESVFTEIKTHSVPDLVVVGHTDTVGTDQYNDALAKQRAETVRSALIGRGVAAADIVAIGRGKRELFVPTLDGVAEPRNRRVEIIVR